MVLPAAAAAGACLWNGTAFPPTGEVTACLKSLPFNASWRDGTVSTIQAMMPSYILADTLTDQGPPVNLKVDLRRELEDFAQQEFDNDAAMWSGLGRIFWGLHDAHTVVRKPKAYANIAYTQPFALDVKMVDKQQKVFLGSEAVDGVWQEVGQEASKMSGLEVVSIDGVAPVTAISDWADANDYISLDHGARFNHAIKGSFVTRRVDIFDIPEAPMKYVLRDPEGNTIDLEMPWIASARQPDTAIDISIEACLPAGASLKSAKSWSHVMPELLYEEPKAIPLPFKSEGWVLESSMSPISTYTSKDGTTAVLKLTSFSPDDVSAYCVNMQDAWERMAQKNVENLIIDVIGNGGGYVCLGYDLVRLIAPDDLLDASPTKYGAPYDLKWNRELSKGLKNGNKNNSAYHELGMDSWLDPKTLTPVNLQEFYDHGPTELRGDVADSRYSPRFFLDCATDDFEGVCELQRPNITFPQDRVLVLTDGTCGSTCATFMHRLQAAGVYAKVAGVGGVQFAPLVTSSFAGGFTGHLSSLNSLFLEEDQIQDFPTNGGLGGFAWAEVYDAEYTTVPAQYAYRTPDLRLDFWDFNGPLDGLYDLAKDTFPRADTSAMLV